MLQMDPFWLPKTQCSTNRSCDGEKDLHLPLGYAASVLQFHYAANWKVGYMMNYYQLFANIGDSYNESQKFFGKPGLPAYLFFYY
jgi:hypothetical protein